MYQYSTLALTLVMIVLSFLWKKADALLADRRVVVAAGAFAAIATLLIEVAFMANNLALFVAVAMATGVGTSVLCLKVRSLIKFSWNDMKESGTD